MGSLKFASARALRVWGLGLVFVGAAGGATAGQAPGGDVPQTPPGPTVTVSGHVYHSVTTKPVAGATVLIEGTTLEATSGADGSFSIPNVPSGNHHLLVLATGFMPARADLRVDGTGV